MNTQAPLRPRIVYFTDIRKRRLLQLAVGNRDEAAEFVITLTDPRHLVQLIEEGIEWLNEEESTA